MKIIAGFIIPLMFSSVNVMAGCDSERGQCYYYVGKELKASGGCEISVCANVESYLENWQWDNGNFVTIRSGSNTKGMLVNGKPGVVDDIKINNNEKLDCY